MEKKIYKLFTPQVKAIDPEAGIYEAMISTEDVDRDGDIMRADGATVDNYIRNPIVLFGHDYRNADAVVGKALQIEKIKGKGIKARWQFAGLEVSEAADTVRRLWAAGFLNATSIGFIPKEWEKRTDSEGEELQRGRVYTEWELLEFSIVPVPANQSALRLAIKALDMEEEKTVIPYRDEGKADEGETWSKPRLSDFTSESFVSLSDGEKRRIARHFTWTANMPPQIYGDLKFPHHRAQTSGVGPAVWRGVAAAMGRLLQGMGEDRHGQYNHLKKHYAHWDKEPPEFREYNEEELKELFPDVEKDPDPEDEDKPNNDDPPHDESENLSDQELDELQEQFDELLEVLQ